jgi:two-component system nitrate/nitrite response regulator NarL
MAEQDRVFRFTGRQREISSLVTQGLSNKEIALRLKVSEGTIKLHLHNVYQRMGIRGRTALTAMLLRNKAG